MASAPCPFEFAAFEEGVGGGKKGETGVASCQGTGLPAGVTPGTIGWVYGDGPNPIAEFDEAGRLRKHFVYLTGSHVPTYYTEYNTLGQRIGTRALITDERHSVRAVVDTTTGAILQTLRYDPFGYVIEETGAGTQPFGFAGGLYDPATQYVRFGFRDYDPNIGRWTAPDPIGFGGGDDDLYGYVGGDPVNRVDPWGLQDAFVWARPMEGGDTNGAFHSGITLHDGQGAYFRFESAK